MKVYVVSKMIGGYAREDNPAFVVVGVYTKEENAKIVSKVSQGRYREIEVDYIPPGIKQDADEFGYKLI